MICFYTQNNLISIADNRFITSKLQLDLLEDLLERPDFKGQKFSCIRLGMEISNPEDT